LPSITGRAAAVDGAEAELGGAVGEHGHRVPLDGQVPFFLHNPDLEKVAEANTLLSGLGFESGGLAAAHAVHTLTQFALEDRPTREYNEFTSFCMSVGLPTTFAGLDLANVTKEELETVAKAATAPGRRSTTCRSRSPRPWWSTRWSPPIPLARLPAGLGPAAGSQRPLMP
jgi:hypothetical protein